MTGFQANKTRTLQGPAILIRGAGELATGVGWTLAKAGRRVIMTEVSQPLMVRWPVCFGTAVADGQWEVEGIEARLIAEAGECSGLWELGVIPVLVDPELHALSELKPEVVIDAIMAKRNLGTDKEMAPLTIGLGPGFCAGDDVDLVIETKRGHNLARLIYKGMAEPDTGIPGEIGGVAAERVVYSPIAGVFTPSQKIGTAVRAGEVLGVIRGENGDLAEVKAGISGMLRGLLRSGTYVKEKVKTGDIDPRGQDSYCYSISEKARAIGAAALLAVLEWEKFGKSR